MNYEPVKIAKKMGDLVFGILNVFIKFGSSGNGFDRSELR